MSNSPLVRARRATGLLTACGALLLTGVSVPAEAMIVEEGGSFETDIDSGSYSNGFGICSLSDEPGGTQFDLSPGETLTDSSDESLTAGYSEDETDTQALRLQGSSTASWKAARGGLRSAGMDATATVRGTAALGDETACRTYLEYESFLNIATEVPSDGFIDLSLRASGDASSDIGFYQRSSDTGSWINAGGGMVKRGSTGSSRTFVEAGAIDVYGSVRIEGNLGENDVMMPARASRAALDTLATGDSAADIVFTAAGSAVSGAKGSGKKYVRLGQRSCGNDTVTTTLKAKASKAKKVTYYVDGKKVRTVAKPKPGKTVKVALTSARDSKVKVVVKPKQGKNQKVTRSYIACTG